MRQKGREGTERKEGGTERELACLKNNSVPGGAKYHNFWMYCFILSTNKTMKSVPKLVYTLLKKSLSIAVLNQNPILIKPII